MKRGKVCRPMTVGATYGEVFQLATLREWLSVDSGCAWTDRQLNRLKTNLRCVWNEQQLRAASHIELGLCECPLRYNRIQKPPFSLRPLSS